MFCENQETKKIIEEQKWKKKTTTKPNWKYENVRVKLFFADEEKFKCSHFPPHTCVVNGGKNMMCKRNKDCCNGFL